MYSTRVDIPKGHPSNSMTWEELKEKFRDCASLSIKTISKENIEKTIELVSGLEKVDDIREVIKLIT